jgi:hypothetical protein
VGLSGMLAISAYNADFFKVGLLLRMIVDERE